MSRSVDLFIRTNHSLEQVADQLGRAVGTDLTRSPNGVTYILRDGDVVAELGTHPYGDDEDLWLSRYQFALSCRVPTDARPQDTPEAAVLRRVAAALREKNLFRVLLVLDLQYRDGEFHAQDTGSSAPPADRSQVGASQPISGSQSDSASTRA